MESDRFLSPLATLGGLGRVPFASGTIGSLAALPFAGLAARFPFWGFAAVLLATPLAVRAAGAVARARGKTDPREVVIDEFLGQILASLPACGLAAACGAAAAGFSFPALISSFLFFRFFDILKPSPLAEAEGLPGGVGIVADDLLAGLLAAMALAGTRIVLEF